MGTESAGVSGVMADILLEFLEVAFHSILYVRELYPAAVFHTTKKYNVPVQMCQHQGVRQYIQDVLSSVLAVLQNGQLEQVVFVMLDSSRSPLQRFVFEMTLPQARARSSQDLCLLKLEQQLRAFILKINTSNAQPTSAPSEISWAVQVHTTQVAALEMQQRQCTQDFTWIPADNCEICMDDCHIIPLKALSCEDLKMQLFIEENGKNG